MADLIPAEEWLRAQNLLIGAALVEPSLIPRLVTELDEDDFAGNARAIYEVMAHLFREGCRVEDITPVVVANRIGDTDAARTVVAQYMSNCPSVYQFDFYLKIAQEQSKLSRLRDMGLALSSALTLESAVQQADAISSQLVDRQDSKAYAPTDLLDAFAARHAVQQDLAQWSLSEINNFVRVKPGKFFIIGAEPSGGKTAFALEQLWSFSSSRRVIFVSLETDEGTLFDRLLSRVVGIPMDDLERSRLSGAQFEQIEAASNAICSRNFKILPGAGMSVAGIKAAAIAHRADIVIVDYLQLIRPANRKASRYEAITEISMDLHILAQSTGLTVIALSQVTNRDPQQQNRPLTIHSARESGQIEADADAMMMLDKHVEKGLRDSGCRANRILRIVKNKNGRLCNIPLVFKGETQTFSRAFVPVSDWADAPKKADGKTTDAPPPENFEQLPMDTYVPF